ncbi:MAG: 2-oxoacid:ferredoxin oxidoreductase subunit beta, partial [Aggregatilineales bacterium]
MAKENALGLSLGDYKGRPTTLCPGCGHNSISNQITRMAFDLNIEQHNLLKMSGIGCSSKSPAYFLGKSHGFNALHGRMPSVATGALLSNRNLKSVAVSGDGDTGSIGFGQFKHAIRRNVPFVYIIENNGVYGLTKGQFSATAEEGLFLKYYGKNEFSQIDLAMEAIIAGATFVARSFSGDAKQVSALLEAAIRHSGTAVIDIISPCVTFNDRDTSFHSYAYGREHQVSLHDIQVLAPDYVPVKEEIDATQVEGETIMVEMHDGSYLQLQEVEEDYDPRNREQAITLLEKSTREQLFLTGLLYYEEPRPTLIQSEELVDTPLAHLTQKDLRPSKDALTDVLKEFMSN